VLRALLNGLEPTAQFLEWLAVRSFICDCTCVNALVYVCVCVCYIYIYIYE
jgi:hypothetical protein